MKQNCDTFMLEFLFILLIQAYLMLGYISWKYYRQPQCREENYEEETPVLTVPIQERQQQLLASFRGVKTVEVEN